MFLPRTKSASALQLMFILWTDTILSNPFGPLTLKSHEMHRISSEKLNMKSPCPDAKDILPCVCSLAGNQGWTMDCSKVESEEELREVFSKDFPSTHFETLIINQNHNIKVLKEGDFGNITFGTLDLENNALTNIDDLAFIGSIYTLKNMYISFNKITSVPDISAFTELRILEFSNNALATFPPLVSRTLTTLDLCGNYISEVPVDAVKSLPKLSNCWICANLVKEILPGTFTNNSDLSTLALHFNNITTLPDNAIELHGKSTELNLENNKITLLSYQAISSVTGDLLLQQNHLTELPEKVFRPLLEKHTRIYLKGNPFDCGCDIAWLILNPSLQGQLQDTPTCSNGTAFADLDPKYYEDNC